MTQQMTDVSLEQVPWEATGDECAVDAVPTRIADARYPELIRHSIIVRVRALLSRESIRSWEASGLCATTHMLLGEMVPEVPAELTAAESVEWKSLSEPDRRALLDVVFVYLGLDRANGLRLLGEGGWSSVVRARNALAAGASTAKIESAAALDLPPPNSYRSRRDKVLLVMGGTILMVTGVYGLSRRLASAPATAAPYLSSVHAETSENRDYERLSPTASSLPSGLGPVDSVCSGDEIVCSSVKTAKPLEVVKAMLATIPNNGTKPYRVNVSVRSTDSE